MNVVKQLRESRGMQQKEFAMRIGVSQPTVSEWEHGKKDPSGERLVKIAEMFGITTLEVLGVPIEPQTKKKPYRPTDEELRLALFDGEEGITAAELNEVKNYARYVAARKKGILDGNS